MDTSRLILKSTLQAVTLSAVSNLVAQFIRSYQDQRAFELDTVELARFITFSFLSCPPNVLWQSWLEGTFPGWTPSGTAGTFDEKPARAMTDSLVAYTQPLREKTAAATTALNENETIKGLKRRATEGVDKVLATAKDIDAKYTPDLVRKATASAKSASSSTAQTFSTPDGQIVEKRDADGNIQTQGSSDTLAAGPTKKLNVRNTSIKFALDQSFGAVINNILFIGGMELLKGESFDQAVADVQRNFVPLMLAGQKVWPAVSLVSFTLVPLEYRTLFMGTIGIFWGVFLSLFVGAKK